MAFRIQPEQTQHDTVISNRVRRLNSLGRAVHTNPDGEKNYYLIDAWGNKHYPDLIVYSNGTLEWIEEVETRSTVTADEARDQWAQYARLKPLRVLVPQLMQPTAELLCRQYGVSAEVKPY